MNKTSLKFQKKLLITSIILICLAIHFCGTERAESLDEIKDLKHYKLRAISYECDNMDGSSRQYSTYLTLQTTSFHKITFSTTSNQCADFYKLIPLPINGEFEIYAKDGRLKQLSYNGKIIVSFESVKKDAVITSTMLMLGIILIGCYRMIQLSNKIQSH